MALCTAWHNVQGILLNSCEASINAFAQYKQKTARHWQMQNAIKAAEVIDADLQLPCYISRYTISHIPPAGHCVDRVSSLSFVRPPTYLPT